VVVLSVPDTLAALRQHREVFVTDGGVDLFEDCVIGSRHVVVGGGHFAHPAVVDRAAGRLSGRHALPS
jgi:hypothetical protein